MMRKLFFGRELRIINAFIIHSGRIVKKNLMMQATQRRLKQRIPVFAGSRVFSPLRGSAPLLPRAEIRIRTADSCNEMIILRIINAFNTLYRFGLFQGISIYQIKLIIPSFMQVLIVA
jgi:hypothetical protein